MNGIERRLAGCTKPFHIGDVLSVTTGILVSTRLMLGVNELLYWMTRRHLFGAHLRRAGDLCRVDLLAQYPRLRNVDVTWLAPTNHRDWLLAQVATFGETLPIAPLPDSPALTGLAHELEEEMRKTLIFSA